MKKYKLGFTLIEMVAVIVVMGVLVVGIGNFAAFSTNIYVNSVTIDNVLSKSRYAVERISRDVREAVPSSVRVTSDGMCLEYTPIISVSNYVDISVPGSLDVATLDANGLSATNKFGIVFPTTSADIYDPLNQKIFEISSIGAEDITTHVNTITFTDPNAVFASSSPQKRFFIADFPVSYCIDTRDAGNKTIRRFSGYNFTTVQPSISDFPDNGVLMAEGLLTDATSYPFVLINHNNTNVMFNFDFGINQENDIMNYRHEVQVMNTP